MLNVRINYETLVSEYVAFAQLSWQYQGDTQIFLYDSEEFTLSSQHETDLTIGLRAQNEQWSIRAYALNITDEENIEGAIDFNNLTTFTNEPRTYGVALTAKF